MQHCVVAMHGLWIYCPEPVLSQGLPRIYAPFPALRVGET